MASYLWRHDDDVIAVTSQGADSCMCWARKRGPRSQVHCPSRKAFRMPNPPPPPPPPHPPPPPYNYVHLRYLRTRTASLLTSHSDWICVKRNENNKLKKQKNKMKIKYVHVESWRSCVGCFFFLLFVVISFSLLYCFSACGLCISYFDSQSQWWKKIMVTMMMLNSNDNIIAIVQSPSSDITTCS